MEIKLNFLGSVQSEPFKMGNINGQKKKLNPIEKTILTYWFGSCKGNKFILCKIMFILCFYVCNPIHGLDHNFLKGNNEVNPHASVQT